MSENRSLSDRLKPYNGVPPTLVWRCEEGQLLGTCDWGHCNGEQIGWAYSGVDDHDEWLAICAECLERGWDKQREYPITESWTFAQVEEALGWPAGAILDPPALDEEDA